MPKNKSKGSKVERELFQMFVDNCYRSVRVAGSGTMENADAARISIMSDKLAFFIVNSRPPGLVVHPLV